MDYSQNILLFKIILCCVFIFFLGLRLILIKKKLKTAKGSTENHKIWCLKNIFLGFLAIISMSGMFISYIHFHGRHYIHFHEMFHLYLGSKYFNELGYFQLYNAAFYAINEKDPDSVFIDSIRDLQTYQLKKTVKNPLSLMKYKMLFTPERWQQFQHDVMYFTHELSFIPLAQIKGMFRDHGFNGTPVWTVFTSIISNIIPVEYIFVISMIDVFLLMVMFIIILCTFGLEMFFASIIFFSLNYFNDLRYIGGSFLRYDWIVCCTIGLCMLKIKRYKIAGPLFAYAVMVKIFPIFFAVGLAIYNIWNREEIQKQARQMFQSIYHFWTMFLITTALLVIVTCFWDKPFYVWKDFTTNISFHGKQHYSNHLGFKTVFLPDPSYRNKKVFDKTYKSIFMGKITNWRNIQDIELGRHKIHYITIQFLMMILLLVAFRNTSEFEVITWGASLIYLFLFIAYYYYTFLLLLFIVYYHYKNCIRNSYLLISLVIINIVLFVLESFHVFGLLVSFLGSSLLFVFFLITSIANSILFLCTKLEHGPSSIIVNILFGSDFKRFISGLLLFFFISSIIFIPILLREPTVADMIETANQKYENNKYEEALTLYRDISKLYPANIDAYFHHGNIYLLLKKYHQAISVFKKALQIDPNNISIHNNIGFGYQMIKEYQKALYHFKKTIELDPSYYEGFYNIGVIYELLENDALAEYYYQRAAELNPESETEKDG